MSECKKCGDKYPVLDYRCGSCLGCSGCCECVSPTQMMGLGAESFNAENDETIYLIKQMDEDKEKGYLVGNERYIREALDEPYYYTMDALYDDEEKHEKMLEAYETMSIEKICETLGVALVFSRKGGFYFTSIQGDANIYVPDYVENRAESFGAEGKGRYKYKELTLENLPKDALLNMIESSKDLIIFYGDKEELADRDIWVLDDEEKFGTVGESYQQFIDGVNVSRQSMNLKKLTLENLPKDVLLNMIKGSKDDIIFYGDKEELADREVWGDFDEENFGTLGEYYQEFIDGVNRSRQKYPSAYKDQKRKWWAWKAESLMAINQNTPISNFTTNELTHSSTVQGDFNQASINSSGHQNFEVRGAETFAARGTYNLYKSQEKVLKAYRDSGGKENDYDSLPPKIVNKLESIRNSETLWSDVNRWLWDNPSTSKNPYGGFHSTWDAESFGAEAIPIRHSRRLNGYYAIKGYEDASEDGFIYRIYRAPDTNDWFKATVYDNNAMKDNFRKPTSRRLNPSGEMVISNDPPSLLIGAFPKLEDAKRALVFRMIQDGNYHQKITDGNLKWLLKDYYAESFGLRRILRG